ncbi:Amino acid transporter transmembrane [Penicillium citrinum]|uniref:Amino acid transporter transmembrane n=1 Tax=Penicillium citrinum TaxID=5077 RepID=A0A9W9NUW1_PENCI|nr:Amino acid transporter transmembrane [Penicillium citrinum]KAJ5226662.1 Amino acid transporter transmembrane [Penicillium citrinum]
MSAQVQSGQNPPSNLESGTADKSNILPNVKPTHDPFGDEDDATVKYKTMTWWQAGMSTFVTFPIIVSLELISSVMIAETISLGILALPKALSILGLLPGIFTLFFIGIVSSYTGYTIGQFKAAHLEVHTMADAGNILVGKVGRRILGIAQLIFFIFVMGSHILTFSLMMNVLSDHSTCTILYSSIGLLPFFFTDSTPTSGTTITPFSPEFHQYHRGSTYKYDRGLSQQNGYESHPTPPHGTNSSRCLSRNSKRDLRLCSWPTTNERDDYVYDYSYSDICLCWSKHHVSSIEFIWDSFRKISYGIAIPTIVIGGVVNAHVAVKYIYVRLDREKKSNTYPNISGPGHMGRNLRCSLAYFMADCRRVLYSSAGFLLNYQVFSGYT